ncbi:hypothetical protein ATANTOWER_017312, partial [Ataeniobius toweri]|nr:hypothetical protein [Ataeniobius toweri]
LLLTPVQYSSDYLPPFLIGSTLHFPLFKNSLILIVICWFLPLTTLLFPDEYPRLLVVNPYRLQVVQNTSG